MRRPIQVFGAKMNDGREINTDSDNIVAVTVHPDKSVTITHPDNSKSKVEGKWVGYVPRFN